jgi:hypothetical protein
MNLADKYFSKARKLYQQENQTKIEHDDLTEYLNSKKQYNVLLNQVRLIEQAFEKKQLSLAEREKRIEVYKILIEGLNELLHEIKNYTHEEAVRGFRLIH